MSAVISEELLKEVKANRKKTKVTARISVTKMYSAHAKRANTSLRLGIGKKIQSLAERRVLELLSE